MKLQTVGKLMIAIGVVVVLYALNMPVSIGQAEVINIHLMNERQNTLIIGGLLFIGGIILFATFKLKQTADEATAESEELSRKQRALKDAGKSFQQYAKQVLTVKRVAVAAVVTFGVVVGLNLYEESQAKAEQLRADAEAEIRRQNGPAEWQKLEEKMREKDKADAAKRLAEGNQ